MSVSQIGQDLFVLEKLNYKKNGIFVDIGCGHPNHISNSFLLEQNYGWTGVGVDLEVDANLYATTRPNTKLIINDALTLDYEQLFKDNNMPKVIDYLSLDLEPPEITFECLFKIPFHEYKFRVITFETDEYREGGERRRDISREYFAGFGYTFVHNVNRQDDFYVLSSEI